MSKISDRHEQYIENIRNPELEQLANEIEELMRYYGVVSTEFQGVVDMVKYGLYHVPYLDELDEDDEDDSELD